MPEISVVLATRNQARWLDAAVSSVRGQTMPDWELLVVDDGSTDDSAAVMARHRDDPRIRWLPGPHRERAAARNRGIAAARAPLLAFLDGDDLWYPQKLARQLDALARRPRAALCYAVARVIDADGQPRPERKPRRPLGADPFAALARGNTIILSSVVVRRAALLAVGGFDESLSVLGCEDWDLWLRLARRWPVVGVEEELVGYRVHGANTPSRQLLESALLVIDRRWAEPDTARRAGLSRATARALHRWWHAARVATATRTDALNEIRRALAEAPHTVWSRPALHALRALAVPRR